MTKNERNRNYYERKKARQGIRSFESDGYPLRLRLQRLLAVIKQRCTVKPTYAGIKCDLTFGHLLFMWRRDDAEHMERPSIDRRDNDGDYTFSNCRFIEFAENVRRGIQIRDAKRAQVHP